MEGDFESFRLLKHIPTMHFIDTFNKVYLQSREKLEENFKQARIKENLSLRQRLCQLRQLRYRLSFNVS